MRNTLNNKGYFMKKEISLEMFKGVLLGARWNLDYDHDRSAHPYYLVKGRIVAEGFHASITSVKRENKDFLYSNFEDVGQIFYFDIYECEYYVFDESGNHLNEEQIANLIRDKLDEFKEITK